MKFTVKCMPVEQEKEKTVELSLVPAQSDRVYLAIDGLFVGVFGVDGRFSIFERQLRRSGFELYLNTAPPSAYP